MHAHSVSARDIPHSLFSEWATVSNINPLKACQPVIYYRPFSVGGPMVGNICTLTACRPMIYYRPFSAGVLTVSNICLLKACRPVI